jgi:hypothetical protein
MMKQWLMRGHQLVGVEAALHERFHLAFEGELHCARRGRFAVRHILDLEPTQLQAGLVRDGLQPCARTDQHRLDQPGGLGVARGGQADFIARMDDADLDAPQRLHVLENPHQLVTVLQRHAHLRQRAARALDALARRDHRRLSADHSLAVLVGAIALEDQAMPFLVPGLDGDRNRERVTDSNRLMKLQRLAGIDRARPGQAGAEHRRDERRAPHAVRNDALEPGRRGELGVDVLRVDVAGHRGEELDVRGGQRALDARPVADGDLVEGAVAQDLEVLGAECAGHDPLTPCCAGRRRRRPRRRSWPRTRAWRGRRPLARPPRCPPGDGPGSA